jgi:hypothetical protein
MSSQQLDLFEECLTVEWIHGEKIRKLEEQQTNLRKGIFGRWKEQEKKIQALSEYVSQILNILEKECANG